MAKKNGIKKLKRFVSESVAKRRAVRKKFSSELQKARLKEAVKEATEKARIRREKRVDIAKIKASRRIALSKGGLGGGMSFTEFVGISKPKIPKPVTRKVKKKGKKKPTLKKTNGGFFVDFS